MKMFGKNYLVQIQEYINENSLKTTSKKKKTYADDSVFNY